MRLPVAYREPIFLPGTCAPLRAPDRSGKLTFVTQLELLPNPQKRLGQFYTPAEVAQTLVRWVVEDRRHRLLDPSCGDGAFLACHRRSVGIELDRESAALAKSRAPWALVHEANFFTWAAETQERFHVAAGNPPFIRYQHFSGDTRETALATCARLGAKFNSLTSSWAP